MPDVTANTDLSVTLFATNDPKNYSGGRYHALIMAYALASAGCRVTVVTDHVPTFDRDLAPLAPNGIRYVLAPDFRSGIDVQPQDWVILVPTSLFLPDFYEAAADYCAKAGARMALLNFESANWYNAVSPHPRDARLWDYWRLSCLEGALVLSSTRESMAHAKAFYRSPHAAIRHDVWYPPINSPLAESFDGLEKEPVVVSFVRPSDAHKGGRDLLRLDPGVLANHRLVLVAGRDVDPAFLLQIRKHFASVPGCRTEVMTRISDADKLRLLTRAKLLVFPTYFEGYGYPPIEAAYCGTPTACYELPVLRETVGLIAGMAPVGDAEALSRAIAGLLANPPAPDDLRAAVTRFAHFGHRAEALVELLLRHHAAVPQRTARAFRCLNGPFARTPARLAGRVDTGPLPEFPCHLIAASTTADGRVAVSGMVAALSPLDAVEAVLPGNRTVPGFLQPAGAGGSSYRFHAILPLGEEVSEATFRFLAGRTVALEQAFRLTRPEAPASALPTVNGVSRLDPSADGTSVRAWVLAHRIPDEVAASADGRTWAVAKVTDTRGDLAEKHPGYPSYKAQFTLRLPVADVPATGLALLLLAGGRVIDGVDGWLRTSDAQDQASAAAPVQQQQAPPSPASEKLPSAKLAVLNLNDSYWTKGVSSFGSVQTPSAFVTPLDHASMALVPGTVLRFAGSGLRRIVKTEPKPPVLNIYVDRPLSPFLDGAPNNVEVVVPHDDDRAVSTFALPERNGEGWLRGVAMEKTGRHRRGFFLPSSEPAAGVIAAGTVLRFAASGERTVVAIEDAENGRRVWLDDRIGPVGDGAPNPVGIVRHPKPGEAILRPLDRTDETWENGIRRISGQAGRHGALIDAGTCPPRLSPGAFIEFPGSGLRRVVGVEPGDGTVCLWVDAALEPARDGHPHCARLLDELATVDGMPSRALYPVPAFAASAPLYLTLVHQARRDGRAIPPAYPPPKTDRPRVLFLTLVPPFPASQGNRVVTRNLIAHLVALGYDVDCVLQGHADLRSTIDAFGDRVRIIQVPFPNWSAAPEVRARAEVSGKLSRTLSGVNGFVAEELNHYHPFFIVRNETVEVAKNLVQTHVYASVMCNYLHMARVLKELEPFVSLPPSCIVTHDALSRLPLRLDGTTFDSMYRACPPTVERDALNSVPGAVIVAISSDEERYFREIGVRNPIVLCEYDACEELAPFAVPDEAFDKRTLIYHASSNPMNVAGLLWFLDNCWLDIIARVPDARLLVCGQICTKVAPDLPGIERYGELSREDLHALTQSASLAINPCVAGTGLKIKTVEAVCLGLPSVCLPPALDGLTDIADRVAIIADTPDAFTEACVTLLTDKDRWQALHRGARELAETRFHGRTVYKALDAAMNWQPLPPPGDRPAAAEDPLDRTAEDQAAVGDLSRLLQARRENPDDAVILAALGTVIAEAGEAATGRQFVERALGLAPDRAHYARLAASLALDASDPWLALLHAAKIPAGPFVASAEGYLLCGQALLARGMVDEAAKALWQAVAVQPGHRKALLLLAECSKRLGRWDDMLWCHRSLRPPPYRFGETLRFAYGEEAYGCMDGGWSFPESWGTWSNDTTVTLTVKLERAPERALELVVSGHGFIVEQHPSIDIDVLVNGTPVDRWALRLGTPMGEWSVFCPHELIGGTTTLRLAFRIHSPIVPATIGMPGETRLLGFALHALRIEERNDPKTEIMPAAEPEPAVSEPERNAEAPDEATPAHAAEAANDGEPATVSGIADETGTAAIEQNGKPPRRSKRMKVDAG